MNFYLHESMPLFLKLINNETMTDKDLEHINYIRDEYSEYLDDFDVKDGIEPLFYIYLGYCTRLVKTISDSENAESTYEFIFDIYDSCKQNEIRLKFETLAEEAFSYINYYKINELYYNLVEYHENEEYGEIETHKELLKQLMQDDPESIDLKAQNNLLHLLLNVWSHTATGTASLTLHICKILEISSLFEALSDYPNLSNMLHLELGILWNEWFIDTYLILFFIPKLSATYHITYTDAARTIQSLDSNDNAGLIEIVNGLLIKSIDTCILKYAGRANNHRSTKHMKNSQDFIVRNIGNINLMELNIEIMFLLLANNINTELLTLKKLDATIVEFMPYASSQSLIFYHRLIINLTPIELKSETQRARFQTLLKTSQTLEQCYYNKTKGASIPAPPRIDSRSLEENIRTPNKRLVTG